MGTGVVTVGHALLTLHKLTARTLEYHLELIPLLLLHHLGQSGSLTGEGLPDGGHELRVLSYRSKARWSYSSFNAGTMRMFQFMVQLKSTDSLTNSVQSFFLEIKPFPITFFDIYAQYFI